MAAFPHSICKTKIVCTIGPASRSRDVLVRLIDAGMNVARLNFSHGDLSSHAEVIKNTRDVEKESGRRVAIMADLPGPKIRIGIVDQEPVELVDGDRFVLATEEGRGDRERVSVQFSPLPEVVRPGDSIYLNDGFIHLEVERVEGSQVECCVLVGGELRSRKGLNLPGLNLGMSAFTEHDHACLKFAVEHGIDAVSQSFVSGAADVQAVREAARGFGGDPFVIAKIERADALENIEEILEAADGVMIARGDLGVEIPVEEIAVVQKQLMTQAVKAGKPVITATHMLESMVEHRRPTRAEATDVANAILDGTDCVMLSGESAMGKYPVESTRMLARIAAATEPTRAYHRLEEALQSYGQDENLSAVDLLALSIYYTQKRVCPSAVIIPTRGGTTARNVTRFRLPVWITAFCIRESACRTLQFSYGVNPIHVTGEPNDWDKFARDWLYDQGITQGMALLTQGPSELSPDVNHRMEIIELG